jgi:hypothetical protein
MKASIGVPSRQGDLNLDLMPSAYFPSSYLITTAGSNISPPFTTR